MTKELFREDGYLKSCEGIIVAVTDKGIVLDQTVFYPTGGGQPGDTGKIVLENGDVIEIIDCFKDRETGQHLHIFKEGSLIPNVGESVSASVDWDRRHRLMRMHSCMHMLCAVVPAPVTGGSIRDDGTGRLDFDLPEPPDKEAIETALNDAIASDHTMTLSWITDEEMQAQPDLVRTMSVKPPIGSGQVRLVQFGEADLQPCGGTHVASSAEIGPVKVESIKKKGKQNRRVTVVFAN